MSYARRTDTEHAKVLEALQKSGYPCRSLHMVGDGLEDIIVPIVVPVLNTELKVWLMMEVKTPRNKARTITSSQFKPAQLEWYERTQGFPRLIVTGAQDAMDKIRRFTR